MWCDIFSFSSGCEAKDSQKSKLNQYTNQEPHGKKTRKEVSNFRCGRKTPENYSRENPRHQAGTENPIHIVAPRWDSNQGPRGGIHPEVEGSERHHYANPTAQYDFPYTLVILSFSKHVCPTNILGWTVEPFAELVEVNASIIVSISTLQ